MEVRSKEEYTVDDHSEVFDLSSSSLTTNPEQSSSQMRRDSDRREDDSLRIPPSLTPGPIDPYEQSLVRSSQSRHISRERERKETHGDEAPLRSISAHSGVDSRSREAETPLQRTPRGRSPQPSAEAKARWAMLASLAGVSHEHKEEEEHEKPPPSAVEREAIIKQVWSEHDQSKTQSLDTTATDFAMPAAEAFIALEHREETSTSTRRESIAGLGKLEHHANRSNNVHEEDEHWVHKNVSRSSSEHDVAISDILKRADEELKGMTVSPLEQTISNLSLHGLEREVEDEKNKTESAIQKAEGEVERHVRTGLENETRVFEKAEVAQEIHGMESKLGSLIGDVKRSLEHTQEQGVVKDAKSEVQKLEEQNHERVEHAESIAADVYNGKITIGEGLREGVTGMFGGLKLHDEHRTDGERLEAEFHEKNVSSSRTHSEMRREAEAARQKFETAHDGRLPSEDSKLEDSLGRGRQMLKQGSRELRPFRLGEKVSQEALRLGDKANVLRQSFSETTTDGISKHSLTAGLRSAQNFVRRASGTPPETRPQHDMPNNVINGNHPHDSHHPQAHAPRPPRSQGHNDNMAQAGSQPPGLNSFGSGDHLLQRPNGQYRPVQPNPAHVQAQKPKSAQPGGLGHQNPQATQNSTQQHHLAQPMQNHAQTQRPPIAQQHDPRHQQPVRPQPVSEQHHSPQPVPGHTQAPKPLTTQQNHPNTQQHMPPQQGQRQDHPTARQPSPAPHSSPAAPMPHHSQAQSVHRQQPRLQNAQTHHDQQTPRFEPKQQNQHHEAREPCHNQAQNGQQHQQKPQNAQPQQHAGPGELRPDDTGRYGKGNSHNQGQHEQEHHEKPQQINERPIKDAHQQTLHRQSEPQNTHPQAHPTYHDDQNNMNRHQQGPVPQNLNHQPGMNRPMPSGGANMLPKTRPHPPEQGRDRESTNNRQQPQKAPLPSRQAPPQQPRPEQQRMPPGALVPRSAAPHPSSTSSEHRPPHHGMQAPPARSEQASIQGRIPSQPAPRMDHNLFNKPNPNHAPQGAPMPAAVNMGAAAQISKRPAQTGNGEDRDTRRQAPPQHLEQRKGTENIAQRLPPSPNNPQSPNRTSNPNATAPQADYMLDLKRSWNSSAFASKEAQNSQTIAKEAFHQDKTSHAASTISREASGKGTQQSQHLDQASKSRTSAQQENQKSRSQYQITPNDHHVSRVQEQSYEHSQQSLSQNHQATTSSSSASHNNVSHTITQEDTQSLHPHQDNIQPASSSTDQMEMYLNTFKQHSEAMFAGNEGSPGFLERESLHSPRSPSILIHSFPLPIVCLDGCRS